HDRAGAHRHAFGYRSPGHVPPALPLRARAPRHEEGVEARSRGRRLADRRGAHPQLNVRRSAGAGLHPIHRLSTLYRKTMRRTTLSFFVAAAALGCSFAAAAANPQVEIKTSMGAMTVELFADKAPKTVDNFLTYVKAGFYNGTIFHRVIPGFMIQGGG